MGNKNILDLSAFCSVNLKPRSAVFAVKLKFATSNSLPDNAQAPALWTKDFFSPRQSYSKNNTSSHSQISTLNRRIGIICQKK